MAGILAQVLQKPVVHKNVTEGEMVGRFQASGIPEEYSKALGRMETLIKGGAEDRTGGAVLALTGRPPKAFKDWAEGYKAELLA